MRKFQRFVGIDWSGAEGLEQSGIQVAEIEVGSSAPHLVLPTGGAKWSRPGVAKYLSQLNDKPTLVGLDFAFSVPWPDVVGPLGDDLALDDAVHLWSRIELICGTTPHLYARPIWTSVDSPFREYIHHYGTGHRGEKYCREFKRLTEECVKNAISIYRMTGVQVGAGSFSGMRMLNHVSKNYANEIAIWPFEKLDGRKTSIVEIYPSYFYRYKDVRRPRKDDLREGNFCDLQKALAAYDSELAISEKRLSVDQADALVSASALREFAQPDGVFSCPPIPRINREGWIFGVRLPNGTTS